MKSFSSVAASPNSRQNLLVLEAECIASRCVVLIKQCVDQIRAVPEFSVDLKKTARLIAATKEDHWEDPILFVKLFTILSSQTSLLQEVTEIHNQAVFLTEKCLPELSDGVPSSTFLRIYPWIETQTTRSTNSTERARLINEIMLPLLAALGKCYEILDRVPAPRRPETAPKGKRQQSKPPPPVAMLSLQHYTDIACLVELTICSSVLPVLPDNVLTPVHERVRFQLPKALKGRIPVSSLLWASKQPPLLPEISPTVTNKIATSELRVVVSVVGRLLLLDRFRPMLLPRHMPDLFAAILFSDELQNRLPPEPNVAFSDSSLSSYRVVNERLMGTGSRTGDATLVDGGGDSGGTVDPHWQAQTYQTLLRKGRDAPVWLRTAVSKLLSAAATRDLGAIVTVFVHEAAEQDQTAAALRLATALVPATMTFENDHGSFNDQYLHAICDQLLEILDFILLDGRLLTVQTAQSGTTETRLRPQHATNIQTVWAVLDRIPERVLDGYFYQIIITNDWILKESTGSVHTECISGIHRIVRRFGILLSVLPKTAAGVCISKICRLFFKPLELPKMGTSNSKACASDLSFQITLLRAIVQLASTSCVLKSIVKDDALLTLRLFVDAMLETSFRGESGSNDAAETASGIDVLAVALVYVLAPCNWDVGCFVCVLDDEQNGGMCDYEPVRLRSAVVDEDSALARIVEGVEQRATLVILNILFDRKVSKSSIKNHQDGAISYDKEKLVSLIFRILLIAYFSSLNDEGMVNSAFVLPKLMCDAAFQLVPLVSLPLLCEACSPESLLFVDGDSSIFETIRIILASASGCTTRDPHVNVVPSGVTSPALREFNARVSVAVITVTKGHTYNLTQGHSTEVHRFGSVDNGMLLSLTSIVLSLLVGILELGARRRTLHDEQMLQSFADMLQSLASISPCSDSSDTQGTQAQVAEMASYAAALIASRSAPIDADDNEQNKSVQKQQQQFVLAKIAQAEHDLMSDQPPLRARGMVTLRKLANSFDRRDIASLSVEKHADSFLLRILHLSVRALADPESYVYLAAIHTVVAVADAVPSIVVPLVGISVATGSLGTGIDEGSLSLEQRVKLTEALVFIIRRKGKFDHELPFLIDTLVFGPEAVKVDVADVVARSIQKKTHQYFVKGSDQSENVVDESLEDYWQGVQLRVRTGGPLFALEEGEVVRAARITVVSELVSALAPAIVARYCPILISCCIDTLRLEVTRPVRRAGAMLARELYAALTREQDVFLDAASRQESSDASMSAAMVYGREDVLHTVLHRIIDALDLKDLREGREIYYDAATAARCQEAVDLRREAESGGILLAGKIALESQWHDESPIARLLKESRDNDVADNNKIIKSWKIEEL